MGNGQVTSLSLGAMLCRTVMWSSKAFLCETHLKLNLYTKGANSAAKFLFSTHRSVTSSRLVPYYTWNDFIVCLSCGDTLRFLVLWPCEHAEITSFLSYYNLLRWTLLRRSRSTFLEWRVIRRDCWIIPGTEIKRLLGIDLLAILETVSYINTGLYVVRSVFWRETRHKHYVISFSLTFLKFFDQPYSTTGAVQPHFTHYFFKKCLESMFSLLLRSALCLIN